MADDKTLASDDTHESSLEVTHHVQLVVNEVYERFARRMAQRDGEAGPVDVADVKAALRDGLRAHGVPQQPEQWIDATASEIAGGRRLVIDAREEVPPAIGRPEGGDRTSRDVEDELDRGDGHVEGP
jgi:hypothetical protein